MISNSIKALIESLIPLLVKPEDYDAARHVLHKKATELSPDEFRKYVESLLEA